MGRLNLGRRFLGLRPFSYTKVGLAELVNKPEAEFEVVNCWCAAVAAVRVFNVHALGVPDCDHSYSCIVVRRRDRFQARS